MSVKSNFSHVWKSQKLLPLEKRMKNFLRFSIDLDVCFTINVYSAVQCPTYIQFHKKLLIPKILNFKYSYTILKHNLFDLNWNLDHWTSALNHWLCNVQSISIRSKLNYLFFFIPYFIKVTVTSEVPMFYQFFPETISIFEIESTIITIVDCVNIVGHWKSLLELVVFLYLLYWSRYEHLEHMNDLQTILHRKSY